MHERESAMIQVKHTNIIKLYRFNTNILHPNVIFINVFLNCFQNLFKKHILTYGIRILLWKRFWILCKGFIVYLRPNWKSFRIELFQPDLWNFFSILLEILVNPPYAMIIIRNKVKVKINCVQKELFLSHKILISFINLLL